MPKLKNNFQLFFHVNYIIVSERLSYFILIFKQFVYFSVTKHYFSAIHFFSSTSIKTVHNSNNSTTSSVNKYSLHSRYRIDTLTFTNFNKNYVDRKLFISSSIGISSFFQSTKLTTSLDPSFILV